MFSDVMCARHGSVSICSCANNRVLVLSGGWIVLDQFTSTLGPRGSPLLCVFTACPPSPSILHFWVLASAIQFQGWTMLLIPQVVGCVQMPWPTAYFRKTDATTSARASDSSIHHRMARASAHRLLRPLLMWVKRFGTVSYLGLAA